MPNASQLFKDDEDEQSYGRPNNDELRHITGIDKNEETAMDQGTSSGASREDLTEQEHNPDSPAASDSSGVQPGALATAEGLGAGGLSVVGKLGSGFNANPELALASRLKNIVWGSKKRKAASIGGGVGAGAASVAFLIMSFVAGPGQLVQLSHVLEHSFSHSDNTTDIRSKGLLRYAKSGDPGETKVGYLGSKIFGNTIDQLSEAGIDFNRIGYTGQVKSVTFDTEKLSKDSFPELEGMDSDQKTAFLANQFGVPQDQIKDMGNGVFQTEDNALGLRAVTALKNKSLSLLDDGKIVTALRSRILAKYFDIPSLFHPLQRVKAAAEQKAAAAQDTKDQQAAEEAEVAAEAEREAALDPAPTPEEVSAEADLKSQLSTHQKVLGSALLLTAGVCLVRSVAKDVPEVNRAAIVAPAAASAVDKIAIGNQIESGQDLTLGQVSAVTSSLTDSTGQNIWSGEALEALQDPGNYGGTDVPVDYAQAFSPNTTTSSIDSTLGGGDLGSVACSPLGEVVQGVVGVGLLISGFADAGASWAAKGAYVGGQLTATAATAGVFAFIQHEAVNLLKDHAQFPKLVAGALGGNLLAYGSREAGNIEARSSGGIALSSSESNQSDAQAAADDTKQFESKSFAYRIFNPGDSRSLVGHLADAMSPNISENVASLVSSFTHIGSLFGSLFTSLFTSLSNTFTPGAHAAQQPYNWAMPEYGIPDSVATDPAYADPYANAAAVATLLDSSSGTNYIQKASACFGVTISKGSEGWDAIATQEVNPSSLAYTSANCSDLGDSNWKRIILFIEDTRTMEGVACYEGDDQSCDDIGAGSGSTDSTATTSAAGSIINMAALDTNSTTVACATGTTDLGTTTGYYNGAAVPIRLCGIPNLPSTGAEATGGYGAPNAGGKASVNSVVSGALYAMVQAADQAGVNLTATSSFRTMDHQECLADHSCGSATAAAAGYSNHQMGLAIDFSMPQCSQTINGQCSDPGNSFWDWLSKNAQAFGYKSGVPSEAWHWSPTGN